MIRTLAFQTSTSTFMAPSRYPQPGTRVMTTLLLPEGFLHLEIIGIMVLHCLVLEILMTTDVVLRLWTETGTPRSLRRRHRRKSIEVAFLLMILAIVVVIVVPRIRFRQHPMTGMTTEEVIVMETTFRRLRHPGLALHLVAGMTLIGCLRGKLLATRPLSREAKSSLGTMLTIVADLHLHSVILISIGRPKTRQDSGKYAI